MVHKGTIIGITLSNQESSTPPPMYISHNATLGYRFECYSPNYTNSPGAPVTMCGLRGCVGIPSTHCSSTGSVLTLCIPLFAHCDGKLTHSGQSLVTQSVERHYHSRRGLGSSLGQVIFPAGYSLYNAYMPTAKSYYAPFPAPSSGHTTYILSLVHPSLWRPTPALLVSGHHYTMTFINDKSRLVWVLMEWLVFVVKEMD